MLVLSYGSCGDGACVGLLWPVDDVIVFITSISIEWWSFQVIGDAVRLELRNVREDEIDYFRYDQVSQTLLYGSAHGDLSLALLEAHVRDGWMNRGFRPSGTCQHVCVTVSEGVCAQAYGQVCTIIMVTAVSPLSRFGLDYVEW